MEPIKNLQKVLEKTSLSEFLPYIAYDKENCVYICDHGVGFMLECAPISGANYMTAIGLKGVFGYNLPEGASIQIMLFGSQRINPILDLYVLMRENQGESILTELARRKKQFLTKGIKGSICNGITQKVRDFRLIVSVVVPCKISPESYQNGIQEAKKVRDYLSSALKSSGFFPVDVKVEDFLKITGEILNPNHIEQIETITWDTKTPLSDQIIFADNMITIEKDYIGIDGMYIRSFTARQFPSEWDITRAINFIGDMFDSARQLHSTPMYITLNCEYPNIVSTVSKVKSKAMAVSYQAFGPMLKWIPMLAAKKQEFDKYLFMLEDGETPILGYLHICIYAQTLKELEEYSGAVQNLYRSMGITLQADDYINLPLFLQSLPLGYMKDAQKFLRRRKTMVISNVAEIAPVQSDWKGFGQPAVLLVSRRGQIQHFNIFDNPQGGYSSVVVASTGSGKSFFVNELISSYLGLGAKLWVIDIGRSYEKICDIVGGEFIVFSSDANLCVNPFTNVVDINEEMPILKSLIATMASKEQLDDLKRSFIEQAIKIAYATHREKTTVTHVAEQLLEMEDTRAVDIGKMLFPFTKNGAYAGFFEGDANITFKSNFVTLELEELKTKPELRDVILLALIFQIQQTIMKDRTQMKILVIDEAWDLLTGGTVSEFIEASYRRFRKYKGAAITITQSVNDFYRIPAGVAILENADFLFLLRQRPESIEALKQSQKISLNEYCYDLLKSLKTEAGNYSEVFVYSPVGITVGRLVVDRFAQLLYTSKADEYTKIKSYVERGYNIKKAIEMIIAEENKA